MKSFFRRVDECEESAKIRENIRMQRLLQDMRKYIKKGEFSSSKKAVRVLLYWGQPDHAVAKCTGYKESSVRVIRRNLSNELYDLFGNDFFTVLEDGDKKALDECTYRFNLVQKKERADSYIPQELIEKIIEGGEFENFSVKECSQEIAFLVQHSIQSFQKGMEGLDKNKLLFLIRVLNKEAGTSADTFKFMSLMDGLVKESEEN